jgi:hypothetical protein
MKRSVVGALLCSTIVMLSQAACTQSRAGNELSKAEGIRVVRNILSNAKTSGSVEYSGRCDFGQQDFPNAQIPAKQSASSAVDLLNDVFRRDPKMRIWQDANGNVRMAEKNVPQDLLSVRISHLVFNDNYLHGDASYHPWDALQAVLETPEVSGYMRSNRISSPTQVVPGMRPVPSPTLPHLSGELDNVTVSEALDSILKIFPGLWIYQDCEGADRRRMVLFSIQ